MKYLMVTLFLVGCTDITSLDIQTAQRTCKCSKGLDFIRVVDSVSYKVYCNDGLSKIIKSGTGYSGHECKDYK